MFWEVTAIEGSDVGAGKIRLNPMQVVRARQNQSGNWYLVLSDGASCIVSTDDWRRLETYSGALMGLRI